MKQVTNLFIILSVATLVAFVTGCSTTSATRQTEDLLSAAGFKAVPATTPQQQAHLKTLTPPQVRMVVRDGKTYYVYPDQPHQVLYVGQEAQFQEYQKLRRQKELAEEKAHAEELKTENAWSEWGAFDVSPVILR
jgi:hypothetical protein